MYRISFSKALYLLVVLVAISLYTNAQIPAFPGAEGWGKYTTGGRGGMVYHVTNLNDSGEGSFRDAVSQSNRIVVFDVGGIIHIADRIVVHSNITVAGQTAPGEGITIYGNGIAFNDDSGNDIIRYIRIRMGKNGEYNKDAVSISAGQNYIFDHVSISWGRDGTLDVNGTGIDSLTFQDCIIGQGINVDNHSTGGLMQSGKWSMIRSLYIDNKTRNPKARGIHEFINSVLYNWAENGYIMGDTEGESNCNLIGNYFIYGPSSLSNTHITNTTAAFHVYPEDNWVDSDKDGVLDGTLLNNYLTATVEATPYNYPSVDSLMSAQDALNYIINNVGASIVRDAVDEMLISQIASFGTEGQIITTEDDNGIPGNVGTVASGIPPKDTDRDGMPDVWEIVHGLNPNSASDANGDKDSDGYTNIEEYINHIVDYTLGCTYKLINKHSSKYLEVLDSSSLAEASIVQNTADSTENQMWTFVAVDSTFYAIINVHSGLAMDVEDSSLADGAYIIQNPFTGGDNQLWEISDLGNDYFKILNKGSGKALDIEGQVITNEAEMIQNTSGSDNSQQFTLQLYLNTPPEVTITSPSSGSLFNAGDTVTITAEATDNESVALVEFYNNGIKVSEDNTEPYMYIFEGISVGTYLITAKAIDNKGIGTLSSTVEFLVQPATEPDEQTITIQENDISFCNIDPTGTIDTNHEGYTGTGFFNSENAAGEGINWIIYVHENDTFTLGIRYACASEDRPGRFIVDSAVVTPNISLPVTGTWTTWVVVYAEAVMDTGTHNIRLEATTSGGLPNIDYITLTGKEISMVNCHPIIDNIANPVAQSTDIVLFPNPSERFLNILLPEHLEQSNLLNIYDYTGKLVLSNRLMGGTTHAINLDNLKSGMYIVQIVNNQKVLTKRLVIKK